MTVVFLVGVLVGIAGTVVVARMAGELDVDRLTAARRRHPSALPPAEPADPTGEWFDVPLDRYARCGCPGCRP